MSAFDWLQQRAPGVPELTPDERQAITDFSIFWSAFEARALGNEASSNSILQLTQSWEANGQLTAEMFAPHLAYFRNRCFQNGQETPHFAHLNLRRGDRIPLVQLVLGGKSAGLANDAAVVFIVVYRYRNNLFHGLKWAYALQGQLDNFLQANAALMKGLELVGL